MLSLACTKPATFASLGVLAQRLLHLLQQVQSCEILLQYGLPACFPGWSALPTQAHLHASPALKEQGYTGHVMQQGFIQHLLPSPFGIPRRSCALTAPSLCHQQGFRNTICHLLASIENAILP